MRIKSSFLAIILVLTLWGCDEISHPLITKQSNGTLPSTPPDFINGSANSNAYKLFIEDCMGHLCSNCPPAVAEGETLLQSGNGSQIVLIEENVGNFADTATETGVPDSAFEKDYRCEAGNNWLTEFKIDLYPWGMVNREGYPSSMFVQYANWADSVTAILTRTTQSVSINIQDSVWVPQRIIGVKFQASFKNTLSGTYLFEPLIVQDSIIDWQADGTSNDSAFVHRYVLRGAFDLSGAGTSIPITTAGSTWTSYQTYDFTKGENGKAVKWNMAHCYIVAFVFNQTTKQVVQAEQIKME